MAFKDYTKKVRINEDQLEKLKKKAEVKNISTARFLYEILVKNLKNNK